jgi:hypothetical protein
VQAVARQAVGRFKMKRPPRSSYRSQRRPPRHRKVAQQTKAFVVAIRPCSQMIRQRHEAVIARSIVSC